jgi:hypothetical protein
MISVVKIVANSLLTEVMPVSSGTAHLGPVVLYDIASVSENSGFALEIFFCGILR